MAGLYVTLLKFPRPVGAGEVYVFHFLLYSSMLFDFLQYKCIPTIFQF